MNVSTHGSDADLLVCNLVWQMSSTIHRCALASSSTNFVAEFRKDNEEDSDGPHAWSGR